MAKPTLFFGHIGQVLVQYSIWTRFGSVWTNSWFALTDCLKRERIFLKTGKCYYLKNRAKQGLYISGRFTGEGKSTQSDDNLTRVAIFMHDIFLEAIASLEVTFTLTQSVSHVFANITKLSQYRIYCSIKGISQVYLMHIKCISHLLRI